MFSFARARFLFRPLLPNKKSPLACLARARPFSPSPTTSKRLLRRLVSFRKTIYCFKEFFTISVKMPKILLFHVTKPKNEVFSIIEVPPFRSSTEEVKKRGQETRSKVQVNKCIKKRDARAKLFFCKDKPIAFLPFSLPSPSSLLKFPITSKRLLRRLSRSLHELQNNPTKYPSANLPF